MHQVEIVPREYLVITLFHFHLKLSQGYAGVLLKFDWYSAEDSQRKYLPDCLSKHADCYRLLKCVGWVASWEWPSFLDFCEKLAKLDPHLSLVLTRQTFLVKYQRLHGRSSLALCRMTSVWNLVISYWHLAQLFKCDFISFCCENDHGINNV